MDWFVETNYIVVSDGDEAIFGSILDRDVDLIDIPNVIRKHMLTLKEQGFEYSVTSVWQEKGE